MRWLVSVLFCVVSIFAWSQVGYVQLDTVLQKTKEGRSINKKLEKEFENRRSQIQQREKKLQDESVKLESEMALLSESEKRKRAKQMQQKAIEYQKFAEASQREMSDYQKKLVASLVEKMKPVIAKIAEKKDLTMVNQLTPESLWVRSDLNITEEVVKAYNKRYK